MQVSKWGNSLAVRLPAALVRELGLREGDAVSLKPLPGRRGTAPTLELRRETAREQLMQTLEALQWPVPSGWRFDRDEAHERGSTW